MDNVIILLLFLSLISSLYAFVLSRFWYLPALLTLITLFFAAGYWAYFHVVFFPSGTIVIYP